MCALERAFQLRNSIARHCTTTNKQRAHQERLDALVDLLINITLCIDACILNNCGCIVTLQCDDDDDGNMNDKITRIAIAQIFAYRRQRSRAIYLRLQYTVWYSL